MIVRDEEAVLERCLNSVADLVDEIIIVDTGSADRTKEIAARYTDRISDFVWIDDFAAARNAAFSKAGCDFCMWLDADDILVDREGFYRLKQSLTPAVDVVMMRYHTGFDENGNVVFSFYRERIIRNGAGMRWKGAVHEAIEASGNVIWSDCAVCHKKHRLTDPDRNLRIYEALLEKGTVLEPRQQFYYGRELSDHGRYRQALEVLVRYLDGGQGWTENQIEACRICAVCQFHLGQAQRALHFLFRSFVYDLPRAEVCCDAANYYFSREQWERAAYWYQRALECERRDERGGFVMPDAYGYLPCIQLCVCYYRLGQTAQAQLYNERAAQYRPDSSAVQYNRAFFLKNG